MSHEVRRHCPHPGCYMKFGTQGSLDRHLARHAEQRDAYKCKLCALTFSFKRQLTAHARSVHPTARVHTCAHCSRTFTARRDLRQHGVRSHGLEDGRTLTCPAKGCVFVAFTHLRLAAHIVYRHSRDKGEPLV